MNTTVKKLAILGLLAFTVLGSACVPLQLRAVGYAATNKVWYHWANDKGTEHKLVVCDVAPDGSESNCKESEILIMKTFAFLLIASTFAAVGVGCAPPRELIKPASAEAKEFNYIYFVEQEQKKDSRLKRCEIAADNSAKCAVMFDLK